MSRNTKRKLSKKQLIVLFTSIVICALLAAPFVYAAFQPNHFPFEPPIEEQVRLQYEALISGDDIPMPIPLVVGGIELREYSLDALRETLTAAGFREVTSANLSEFTQDVQSQFGNDPMFASPDEKLRVMWMDLRPYLNSNGIMINATKRRMTGSEIAKYFSDGSGSVISLPFGVEPGSSVSDALSSTRWINKEYRFKWIPRRLKPRTSESITINRGCYMYSLRFSDGRLWLMSIIEMREMYEKEISGKSRDKAVEYLGESFGKRTVWEKMNLHVENLLNRLRR